MLLCLQARRFPLALLHLQHQFRTRPNNQTIVSHPHKNERERVTWNATIVKRPIEFSVSVLRNSRNQTVLAWHRKKVVGGTVRAGGDASGN